MDDSYPTTIFDPGAIMPFMTYRRFIEDEEVPLFDMAPSLVHFYESEKFRGTSDALRLEVLSTTGVRAVQKITKRNKQRWREDWRAVRSRVFRAGLAMQVMQSKEALSSARSAFDQSMELASIRRVSGLPGSFLSSEIQAFFQKANGTSIARIGVIALAGCVPSDIEERLDALFSKDKPVSAAIYAGRDCDTRIERWCAQAAVPVRLTGVKAIRIRDTEAVEVTARINTLISCMPKTRKATMAILAAAASKRPKIRVLDFCRVPGANA